MKILKIIGLVVGILVVIIGFFIIKATVSAVDPNNPPQFIQADFVDLSKIYSVSKFRSGEGHDFSGNGETCRSMKHYFIQQFDPEIAKLYGKEQTSYPKPDPATAVAIFSPVDGNITAVEDEHTPIGQQISIVPTSNEGVLIRLFHVYLLNGIGRGSKLKAGQQIGMIAKGQGTDIAIQAGTLPWQNNFISYFAVMPDSVFAAYKARGATSRDEFIVSKDYRDAHPFQCGANEQFLHPQRYDQSQDDVHLSGYTAPNYGQQGPGNQGGQ